MVEIMKLETEPKVSVPIMEKGSLINELLKHSTTGFKIVGI
jgi:hypothetical protein